MENKVYRLRYLPLFEEDLVSTADYIANKLQNPAAAAHLVDAVEAAIRDRLHNPLAFEPYRFSGDRNVTYYRIYVKNYVVYYVVIDDVMEVRRLLYGPRDAERYL